MNRRTRQVGGDEPRGTGGGTSSTGDGTGRTGTGTGRTRGESGGTRDGRRGVGGACRRDRGQLVLVAAGVVAVALLSVLFAYAQLGYDGIGSTDPTATTPDRDAVDGLQRAAFAAASDEQGRRDWANRSATAAAVTVDFDERAAAIETGDLRGGRVHQVERNASAAAEWADENCPAGPGRAFGPCLASGGVVLQERAGDAHVLAVAVDVRTVTDRGTYRGRYVLDAELGTVREW